ncbi:hypothetical protein [Sessilibacter corallicola]|uniref:hypothetical protein n=1 Tax=Sessilibacter corallicola TaxID=2904075 RepID=UPI001E402C04|nr:hypothetical protein [Sessilibacter corallicola]MCE2030130.1 hypothetical protein [Sessilibacter corallicola]
MMDLISVPDIVETLRVAIGSGATEVANSAVKSAFDAIKQKITDLLGPDNPPNKALESLEQNPESKGYKTVLAEELENHKISDKEEIQTLIKELIAALQQTQSGKEQLAKFLNHDETNIGVQGDNITVNVSGDYNVKKT